MALQLKGTTNYAKINKDSLKAYLECVIYHTYESKAISDAGLSEFQTAQEKNSSIELTDEEINAVLDVLYAKLKLKEEFAGATDV